MVKSIIALLALTILIILPPISPAQAEDGRVIVLGFDGADATLTQEYMDQGLLPHLAALRNRGAFRPLNTTTPPQTPVSWASFATGTNPGKHGIFDFLRRDPATYEPTFAMFNLGSATFLWGKNNHWLVGLALFVLSILLGVLFGFLTKHRVRSVAVGLICGLVLGSTATLLSQDWLPYRKPTVENARAGETFWELAGRHGIPTTVVRVPATFPPRAVEGGELLSGLGTPDIRGTTGTYSFFTTDPPEAPGDTEFGGKITEIGFVDGVAHSEIVGPRNRLFDHPPDILIPVEFSLNRDEPATELTITASGASQTLKVREWSQWFTLEFAFSPLVKVVGTARFFFDSDQPFRLYLSPINLDPHRPVMPVSQPPEFSRELAQTHGLYKTLGWGMETWALNEENIDEGTFLEDVYFTEDKFAEIMRDELEHGHARLFVQVYELTDRVAHMFWRFMDPTHPAYDPDLAELYGNAVRDSYVYMDKVVGEAMDLLSPEDRLIVLSDHGFHTWHKSVNYNTWLVRNGFMTLKQAGGEEEMNLEDLFGQGEFWPNVDWSRTKAYALGLGDIYINLKGREGQGIVLPGEEYERIRNQVIQGLLAFEDMETGGYPVRSVYKREDIYAGYDPDLIPDLVVANNPKYRVSWQTSLGGIPKDLFTINNKKWSGDHCSLDAEITQGVFFSSEPILEESVSILDIFPTVIDYLGIPKPENLDGTGLTLELSGR